MWRCGGSLERQAEFQSSFLVFIQSTPFGASRKTQQTKKTQLKRVRPAQHSLCQVKCILYSAHDFVSCKLHQHQYLMHEVTEIIKLVVNREGDESLPAPADLTPSTADTWPCSRCQIPPPLYSGVQLILPCLQSADLSFSVTFKWLTKWHIPACEMPSFMPRSNYSEAWSEKRIKRDTPHYQRLRTAHLMARHLFVWYWFFLTTASSWWTALSSPSPPTEQPPGLYILQHAGLQNKSENKSRKMQQQAKLHTITFTWQKSCLRCVVHRTGLCCSPFSKVSQWAVVSKTWGTNL